MKNNLLFAFLLLTLACSGSIDRTMDAGRRFTEINGLQSGVLTRSQSPYHVTGTLTVAPGAALEIEAGVSLSFDNSIGLIIQGSLQATGTTVRFISFQAFDNPIGDDDWDGIKFVAAGAASQLAFCTIQDVRIDMADSLENATIEVVNSQLEMSNCIIRNNSTPVGGGLFASRSRVTIKNSIFRDNQSGNFGAAILCIESEAEIINNTIFNNRSINIGSGLVLVDQVSTDVQNNIFFQNTSGTGDPRIAIFSGDSTNFHQAFNFLPFGRLDPRFISNENLHLSIGSPAMNTGNPDPAFNDIDGTRNDQGAFGGPLGNWL